MLLKNAKQTFLEACLSHKKETLVYKGGIVCNIHVSQVFLTSNLSEMEVINPVETNQIKTNKQQKLENWKMSYLYSSSWSSSQKYVYFCIMCNIIQLVLQQTVLV